MNTTMLRPGIYYVGAVDWNSRSFHGYSVHRGVTYNAYLIVDDKIALIDTVKKEFANELINRISEIVDPSKIDYIISNHVEMDHSGALPSIMEVAKDAVIITSSPNGKKGLTAHYGANYPYQEVKAGDSLSLGKHTLQFVGTPMLHWPDNMVTYCPEEKILFSNDAFGQHYSSNHHFDDEVEIADVLDEARHYFANILMPYGAQAKKVLSVVEELELDMIAPSHGVIWRSHIKDIMESYHKFANNTTDDYALVVYDTMWHSTEKMAHSVAEGFAKRGTRVKLLDLNVNVLSDIMKELQIARYIAVGCPTLDSYITPNMGAFLTYMKCLSPKGKKGFAFGSYGWGGQSIGIVNQQLQDLGVELILDPIKINYIPNADQLLEIENMVAAL